jgi:lipooligosaccharide transport system permease protein
MNKDIHEMEIKPPSYFNRLYSVWFRHYKVYTKNFISNGFPPFLEPLFFIAAFGIGFSGIIEEIHGRSYLEFIAIGMLVPTAMFTAAFECSFGTFIRLEFEKVYEGMVAAPITAKDLLIGEIIFSGTKGFFFTSAVLFVISLFGLVHHPIALISPFIGFIVGVMFSSLSLFITSFVKNINHFNFYFTGLLTPLFFFSGILFPLSELGKYEIIAWIFPLAHPVELVRAICWLEFDWSLLWNAGYIFLFTAIFSFLGIFRLEKRLID